MLNDAFERLDPVQLEGSARLFEALAHPVRLRIVCGLLDGACCVGPMTDCLGLPQAFVSRHLAILREAGIVESVVDGRRREYRVVHPLVAPIVELLQAGFPPRVDAPAPAALEDGVTHV